MGDQVLPFHTYIVKVASRCNLNCSYCFIYNLADTRWAAQPRLINGSTFLRVCTRIRDHCVAHKKTNIAIVLHGGEPLLGGSGHLRQLLETIKAIFSPEGIKVRIGIQSNGLLFSTEIGDLLLEHNATIGISMDGPPAINDAFRVDHNGLGSSLRLESRLRLLTSTAYKSLFSGFLIVVNLLADPREVLDYVLQFSPPEIDFLLPYDNWDRRPPGKIDFENSVYGDWLIKAFDYWVGLNGKTKIRHFASIMRLALGAGSLVETIGLSPITLIVIETNGEIEALDSLKGTYDGATALGLNVFDHDLDMAATHVAVRARQSGATGLCATCRDCSVVNICGGGYLPNRYSASKGFQNPSIFCRDLEKVIRHIHRRLDDEVTRRRVGVAIPCHTSTTR